jgi:glycosyltransferase involved in cell wall biosynthesis
MSMNKKSLSIVVPCFNEELNIIDTLNEILLSLQGSNLDFEIIIIDDFSSDNSNYIIQKFIKINKTLNVKFYTNKKNLGLANSLLIGIKKASMNYITWVPGDNNHPHDGLGKTYQKIHDGYDLIIPYHINLSERKITRFLISKIYTFIVNVITNNKINYYNGLIVYKRSLLNIKEFQIFIKYRMSFLAAITLHTLKKSSSFIEVPVTISENKNSRSTSLNLRSLMGTIKFLASLLKNEYFKK